MTISISVIDRRSNVSEKLIGKKYMQVIKKKFVPEGDNNNPQSKMVGVLGTSGLVRDSYLKTTDDLLSSIGKNTGNLLFQKAVTDAIAEPTISVGEELGWDIQKTQERCRVLVVPSANFIRENADFSSFVDFMDKVDLPLVFLGLGAQAVDFSKQDFDFHPSILRLIDLCRERSKMVGVRGVFTQELLERYNMTNTTVIGCPSNFLNRSPDFRKVLEQRWNDDGVESFMVAQDELWPGNSQKLKIERKLLDWAINGAGVVVQQSVEPLLKFKRGLNRFGGETRDDDFPKRVGAHLAPHIDASRFRSFVSTRMRLYYSVDQWMEDCASFSFCTGLRLHGNMMAWQAGTPAVWLHHDSRTKELVECMGLPNMSVESAVEADSISQIKNMVEFDSSKYFDARERLHSEYLSIFDVNKIKSFSLFL